MNFNHKQKIHSRLSTFVDWIATDKDKVEEIKRQAEEIRDRIKPKAVEDGLTVAEMPFSGSFAKKTGLRRYLQGNSEVEGQDVDLAFILEAQDSDGNDLDCQIYNFKTYLEAAYPNCEIGTTKSSATIAFKSTKLSYDLVPLIKTSDANIQTLIRTDGESRQSSVKKHLEFAKDRNRSSDALYGRVCFNQCARLIKWWRYHKQSTSGVFGNGEHDDKIPSILLDLLCAHAYDHVSVQSTYHETLGQWFSFLASEVRKRAPITFTDFIKSPQIDSYAQWYVGDPVDDTNNITASWQPYKIDELADWLAEARDRMAQAIRHDGEGEHFKSRDCLVEIFGNSFKNKCE